MHRHLFVKNRAYNQSGQFNEEEQNGAIFALNYCLDNLLKLLAPVIPFMTYKIYTDLRGKDIHKENFPEAKEEFTVPFSSEDIIELNSALWKAKKDNNLSLKSEVKEIIIPKKLQSIEKDITMCHNVKKIVYGDNIKVKL